jgi:transcriptional regulator with XRE-family HTH domain
MGFNVEKLAAMAKPCSEDSLKQARFRKENREWLRISQEIALALHYYLRKQNMTQKALADKMGMSPVYINKLLKGNENLTLETICKIQNAIGSSIINVARPYVKKTTIHISTSYTFSQDAAVSEKYSEGKSSISKYASAPFMGVA